MTEFETMLHNFFTENTDEAKDFMYGYVGDFSDSFSDFEGVTQEQLDHYGGEDMGAEYYSIYSFTKDGETVYIRFDGYYTSYNGADYQGFKFVKPTPVQRIEYI